MFIMSESLKKFVGDWASAAAPGRASKMERSIPRRWRCDFI
jgi:hypothetical protein